MCDGIAMMGLLCFGITQRAKTCQQDRYGECNTIWWMYEVSICNMLYDVNWGRHTRQYTPDARRRTCHEWNSNDVQARHDFFLSILTANKLILLAISKNWSEGCITESYKTNLEGFTTQPLLYINLVCPSVNLLITSRKFY